MGERKGPITSIKNARTLLTLQQDSIQHFQTLCRGLIGVVLSISAIAVTVSAAVLNYGPQINPSEGSEPAIRNAVPIIDVEAWLGVLTIVFNYLITLANVILGILILGEACWLFFQVLSNDDVVPILKGENAKLTVLPETDLDALNIQDNLSSQYSVWISQYEEELKEIYGMFQQGLWRIPLGFFLLGISGYTYWMGAKADLSTLVLLDIVYIVVIGYTLSYVVRDRMEHDFTLMTVVTMSLIFGTAFSTVAFWVLVLIIN
jgi:hypothetical protein